MTALATLLALALQQPQGDDGLKKLNEDLLAAFQAGDKEKSAALVKGLRLPDSAAWFKKTFGDETGERLETEYRGLSNEFDRQISDLYADCVKEGRTAVRVVRLEQAGRDATGLQNSAFEAMRIPVVLYTVKLTKPGEPSGVSLWSFVQIDGAFRLVGKLRAVKPPAK